VTCRECSEFLADYVSGELDPAVQAILEHHLELCPNCVTYVKQYSHTIVATRAAFSEDPGEALDLPEELIRAILAARQA
jgi:anti-sigma factor RsiW